MPHEIDGQLTGQGLKVAIAATRFNGPIVQDLVDGAVDGLLRHGVADDAVTIVRCPGSWELPFLVQRLAQSGKYDAIIPLGVVIRGETSHFDHLVAECVKGLGQVQMQAGIPVVFGVLTTDTVEQAMNRAGIKHGNKGFDCALAAIEMCRVVEQL